MRSRSIQLLTALSFLVITSVVSAQSPDELPPEERYPRDETDTGTEDSEGADVNEDADAEDPYGVPDEDFTGTFAEDEDEDNPEFQRRKDERDAFEGGEIVKDEDVYPEDDTPAYLLQLEFEAQVVMLDKDNQPYMEINYTTKVEHEVALVRKRWRAKAEGTVETDIVGNLAGNELFTCKLDIMIENFPVDVMTRLKRLEETEETPEMWQVATQLKLNKKKYSEHWYSNCTGIDGATFNTKGDPERYGQVILEQASPGLNGIVLDDFDIDRGGELEITVEAFETVDEDMGETTVFSGGGTLRILPLGG